jgi:2-isopropylmalate synthase
MMKNKSVELYDTTLRDGSQAEDIAFSLEDKLRIARRLDELSIHYIEGGWPGSNPKDISFFRKIKDIKLHHAKIAAFGSTHRANLKPEKDPNLKALLEAQTSVVTIFGKTWDLQVTDALRISLEENINIIYSTLHYLRDKVPEVFFDAEHFFDGYKSNPEFAMQALKSAEKAKADLIVLCDTNGGTLPHELVDIIKAVKKGISTPLGIHAHNDSEVAVANSVLAVKEGITHVQGTINGFGERCGNANLCSIIPNLKLKLGINCIGDKELTTIRETARFVSELANFPHNKHQPYVGNSAFAHKGGIHVSAVQRNSQTYEHIKPELVGNHQRILISDLSGRANILYKAEQYGIDLKSKDPVVQDLLVTLKDLEHKGFQYEGAEASFELLMREALKKRKQYFKLLEIKVFDQKRRGWDKPFSEAIIRLEVDGKVEHTAAEGNGPVNALDNALRKALENYYPTLREMSLIDFKVRVLTAGEGTAASVRVLIESGDEHDRWGTVGVSENVIEASWQALVDGIDYKLYKDEKRSHKKRMPV